MKHIIYMAAGNSSRFGGNKLLHDLGGKPVFRYGLDVIRSVVEDRDDCTLTAVTQYSEIRDYCAGLGIRCVVNPDSRLGASYTVRAGIRAAEPESGDFLIFSAADQPYIRRESFLRLLDAVKPGVQAARIYYGDTPGNPVAFSAELLPALNALTGDDGGRSILKGRDCLRVQAETPAELHDIDAPEDL